MGRAILWRPIPMLLYGNHEAIDIMMSFFTVTAIIIVLLPFHEFAHAWAAYKLGDNTAKNQGRLTLNPFVHIDPLGALCMLIFPLGWAKPVIVDPRNASRKVTMRGFMALTALAGPVSNILMSFILVIIVRLIILFGGSGDMVYWAVRALSSMAWISVYLAVFNLIPIPPLDGSKVLFFFLNDRAAHWFERNSNIIRMALLLSLIWDNNPLFKGMYYVSYTIMRGLYFVVGL
ncbi:MAG: site-2 protease family protein [Oscillospiraceae bacterium]|nr:site-2 protease family protein [Oscillospiraceae bacterium]